MARQTATHEGGWSAGDMDLSPRKGKQGRVGQGDGSGLLIINQKDGGRCERCGRDSRVYWVNPVKQWLCARDLREG